MQSASEARLFPSWSDRTLAGVCWWHPRHVYVLKFVGWHVVHVESAPCLGAVTVGC